MEEFFGKLNWPNQIKRHVIPDDEKNLHNLLKEAIKGQVDFVFTTGGTGIGPRDITPEVVRTVIDKEIPGIMEMIRMKYGMDKPNALLSRSLAGVAGKTIIYALPGSVKAVNEYMAEITKTMKHTLYMLHGLDAH
jgi:molybdenum cofactor synthesis domain-containing protein